MPPMHRRPIENQGKDPSIDDCNIEYKNLNKSSSDRLSDKEEGQKKMNRNKDVEVHKL